MQSGWESQKLEEARKGVPIHAKHGWDSWKLQLLFSPRLHMLPVSLLPANIFLLLPIFRLRLNE